jgi:hypothetical protein
MSSTHSATNYNTAGVGSSSMMEAGTPLAPLEQRKTPKIGVSLMDCYDKAITPQQDYYTGYDRNERQAVKSPFKGPSLEDLKHLARKWPKKEQQKPPKNSLALAGDSHFSADFARLFKANVTNIYGLEDDILRVADFEARVDEEALRQFRGHSNRVLENILHAANHVFGVESSTGADGKLRWRIPVWNIEGYSLVDLIRNLFNISRLDALATLAVIVYMSFENVSQLSSESHVAEEKGIMPLDSAIPSVLFFARLQGYAQLINLVDIVGHSGQIIGAIAQYRYGESIYCLPATVGRRTLSIGIYKATAFWLDQHKIDVQPAATIILCQDIRTAIALRTILEESRSADTASVIVTGHLFDDLSILPWNYFHGHDVVLALAPTKSCMAMVKPYRDYVMGAGAKSFKVAKHMLLHSKPSDALNSPDRPKLADVEEELLRNAVFLDDEERPILFIRQLLNTAISYDAFKQWGQKAGIFKRPKQEQSGHTQDAGGDLKIFDPGTVVAASQPSSILDVGVSQIAPPGSLIVIHGFKNAGKSYTGFEAARSVIFGLKAFGVFPSNRPPGVAYLLDSETPTTVFAARIGQYGLLDVRGTSFFPISKEVLIREGEENPSLTNPNFRARLEAAIYKNKADFLVIDNLTTLSTKGGIYQPGIASEILDWAATLTARGVTVLVVHHSDDQKGKQRPESAHMRGSSEFSIRAHTEIVVIGQKQILEYGLGTEAVQDAARMDGATIGLQFNFCKTACVLERHTFWLHLPLDGNAWDLLAVTGRDGEPIDITMPISPDHAPELDEHVAWLEKDVVASADNVPDLGMKTDGLADSQPTDSPDQGLSEDEMKVMEHVKTHNKIKVSDACNLLGYGETTARKALNGLVDKGKLLKLETGQGLPTVYGLSD